MPLYNKYYYNETIRKYVVAFGHLFTNIFVSRSNGNGDEIEREIVPISYSPKEKFVQRIESDYAKLNRVAMKLPRIGFEIVGYQYAPERKLPERGKKQSADANDPDKINWYYNPVPYDFDFDLAIVAKTQEEGLQIIEQILPFFTPHYTFTMKLTDLTDYKQDVSVSLLSVTSEDNYAGSFEDRRAIIWTLSFKLKGFLIGPKRTSARILNATANVISINSVEQEIPANLASGTPITGVYNYNVFDGIDGDFDTLTAEEKIGSGVSFAFPKNTDFTASFTLTDENGDIVDLSAGVLTGTFKESFSSDTVININSVSYVNQQVVISINSSTTTTLSNGIYIFNIFYDDGTGIETVVQGTFNIT